MLVHAPTVQYPYKIFNKCAIVNSLLNVRDKDSKTVKTHYFAAYTLYKHSNVTFNIQMLKVRLNIKHLFMH